MIAEARVPVRNTRWAPTRSAISEQPISEIA